MPPARKWTGPYSTAPEPAQGPSNQYTDKMSNCCKMYDKENDAAE